MQQSPLARVQFVREALIRSLAGAAQGLSSDRDPIPARTVSAALAAMDLAMDGYLAMVKATSTSSHERYAERDLPEDEGEHLAIARHHLRLLHALYGPQEAAPQPPRFPIPQREQDDAADDGSARYATRNATGTA